MWEKKSGVKKVGKKVEKSAVEKIIIIINYNYYNQYNYFNNCFLNLKLQDLLRATIQAQEAIDKRLQDRLPSKGEAASGESFQTSFEISDQFSPRLFREISKESDIFANSRH